MQRTFLVLIGIQSTAAFFAAVTSFTISASLFVATQSAMVMALAVFFQLAPRIYFSFFGGVLVDRINVLTAIRFSNFAEAGASLATMIAIAWGGNLTVVFWLFILARAVIASVKSVAMQASVKHLVNESDFRRASGLTAAVQNTVVATGPFLGLAVYSLAGAEYLWAIFALDALAMSMAGLVMLTLKSKEDTASALPRISLTSLRAGLDHIAGQPQLRLLLIFFASQNFFNGLCAGLIPFLLLSLAGDNLSLFAIGTSALSVGAIVGSLLAAMIPLPKNRVLVICISTILAAGAGRFFVGLNMLPWLIVAGFTLRAVILPVGNVVNQAIWLEATPKDRIGQVLGTRRAIAQGSYPLAVLLSGFIAGILLNDDIDRVLILFAICGVGEILCSVWLIRKARTPKLMKSLGRPPYV